MPTTITTPVIGDLTEATLAGDGTFDTLMRATKVHLEAEFSKNRIKGTEYSTVYLGSLQAVMQTGLAFLLQKDKAALEAQLIEQQVLLAQVEVLKANVEMAILQASLLKIPAEIDLLEAQTAIAVQQKLNLVDELLTSAAQREKIDQEIANLVQQEAQSAAQTALITQQQLNLVDDLLTSAAQRTKITQEIDNLVAQEAILVQQKLNLADELLTSVAQRAKITQETTNLVAEALNIPKQGALLDAQEDYSIQQTANLVSQELQIDAQTGLITQQAANAVIEGTVLVAQECKLRAEFDNLEQNVLKTAQETSLLAQKVSTEKAQILALGVDDNSVLGKQKALYQAQTDGFVRDAEQKAAKLMADTWNVRRTTDEATVADGTNNLNDAAVGRAITKLLAGINA